MSEMLIDLHRKKRRPLGLWLMAMIFALFAVMGMARAWMAWFNGEYYLSIGIQVAPVLLVVYGVIWVIGGLGGAVTLFIRRSSARLVVWICAGLLTISYWLDRLLLTVNPNRQINTGFALLTNLLLLGCVAWVLHRKRATHYFQAVVEEKADRNAD